MKPTIASRFRAGDAEEEKLDVWTIVNTAAALSTKKPLANLGQGFFGYNPPQFVLDATKEAVERVDCNQYSPTRGRPRLRKALADAYSPFFGRDIDPDNEVLVTTGANEGLLCAIMAFIEPGDEVIVFEPFFDQYIRNIQLGGGVVKYVPLTPPSGSRSKDSSAEWKLDLDKLSDTITPRTKMLIINTPLNPVGKIFSREELLSVGEICVKHSIIILSDEVYDRLYYEPFTRLATLSSAIADLTLTFGSAGKTFYATGWRIGYVIGPKHLIDLVGTAHMWICFASPSPLQEAVAVGFEQAASRGFWETTRIEMKGKMDRFNQIWEELDLRYTDPQGGYFVLVNTERIQLPKDYSFPPDVECRSRDYKMSYFLIQEFGVVAIPPTDFYGPDNAHLAENYLRFAICKPDDVLELAKERLRGLRKYIQPLPKTQQI